MGWKSVAGFFIVIAVVIMLIIYYFFPFGTVQLSPVPVNSNFTINPGFDSNAQFYQNLRYPDKKISYKVYSECTLKKKQDAETAFQILEDRTILDFFPVQSNEKISVTCQDDVKDYGRFFVAGEGGPVNITSTENFNVIRNGKILLIEESKCSSPNVAIHEILHALGFEHSQNPGNIMYNLSNCNQEIGTDTIALIDNLYSYSSYPDLVLENVSAEMHGKYLNVNFSIRNHGLKKSETISFEIYADEKMIKEISVSPLEIGFGITYQFTNIFINKLTVSTITFKINSSFSELDKNNNEMELKIKN